MHGKEPKDMPDIPDDMMRDQLLDRVGKYHLDIRLGIEQAHHARVFGQGRTFFHPENWYSVHGLMRFILRATLLDGKVRRNARNIQVENNIVAIDGLAKPLDGFTILQISDLHLDMAPDLPHALIACVRELEYDICVMTGDYRARTYGPCEAALRALQQLRLHLSDQVYAILGNHDSIRMLPAIEEMGVRVLVNQSVRFARDDAELFVCGIDDPHYHRADNMEKAVLEVPSDAVSVLLSHSPEVYRHASCAGFDLMLCGHTHGGQICLPGGIPLLCNADCPRAFCRGVWRYHRLQGYTSRGSGVSILDARLNCPPEVTLHTLRRGDA
jgi:predicted MPP superfamily phosphohydrolase